MKITEKCKVIVASSLVAALMTGTALPALAASPAGDVPFAVLAQQNIQAYHKTLLGTIVDNDLDRLDTIIDMVAVDFKNLATQQTRGNRGRSGCL